MPLIQIHVRKRRNPEGKKTVMDAVHDAVHDAVRDALKLPERDRQIRYVEHEPENFEAPPDRTDAYTLVEITLFDGRSMDAKRTLYRSIVRNLGGLGVGPGDVFIVLHEVPLDNWGVRGGLPASEVDLGFRVDV